MSDQTQQLLSLWKQLEDNGNDDNIIRTEESAPTKPPTPTTYLLANNEDNSFSQKIRHGE